MKTLALYTTIYPGVEGYLPDWYHSLMAQSDQDYELWIGLDGIGVEAVREAVKARLEANWIVAAPRDTPAQVRQAALERIVETYDGVVLVDSDDLLHPSRMAAAREALETSDLAGCALRLVDQGGRDLGLTFSLPDHKRPGDVFPRNNVFGLSNSAFRSDLLWRCLPLPADAALVDWFLSTRAWLYGARLAFDPIVRMDYRQHGANMARVVSPFDRDQIIRDTARVRHHFQIVLADPSEDFLSDRLYAVELAAADVEAFYQNVVLEPTLLGRYVEALNALELEPLWWSSIANPLLGHMWNSQKR